MKCRILIIVQNLPVPFDRRVWLERQALTSAGYRVAVVRPKGSGDPAYEVVDTAELYKYPLNDVSTMNKTMEYMAFELPVVAFDLRETVCFEGLLQRPSAGMGPARPARGHR